MGAPCGASFPHAMRHLERPRLDIQNRWRQVCRERGVSTRTPRASSWPALDAAGSHRSARTGWVAGDGQPARLELLGRTLHEETDTKALVDL